MKFKAVIFDFDGTLMNTFPLIISSWQHTARKLLGHELSDETIRGSFGEVLEKSCKRLFPGIDPKLSESTYRQFQNSDEAMRVHMPKGTEELVRALSRDGARLAIVTSRHWKTTENPIYDFPVRDLFEVIIDADATPVHKPDPFPILLCLERLGISAKDAIYIGDTDFDIECAKAAGVKSVLVSWARDSAKQARQLPEADFFAKKAEDLYPILQIGS